MSSHASFHVSPSITTVHRQTFHQKNHKKWTSYHQSFVCCVNWAVQLSILTTCKLLNSQEKIFFPPKSWKMKYRFSLFILLCHTCSMVVSFAPTMTKFVKKADTSLFAAQKKKKSNVKANHVKWQPNYDALAKYKHCHGHCEVTEEDDADLHGWLEDQRKSYAALQAGRKTKLTKKRAVALEQLGAIPPELMM